MKIAVEIVYKLIDKIETYNTYIILQDNDKLYYNEKFSKLLNKDIYNYKIGSKFIKIALKF